MLAYWESQGRQHMHNTYHLKSRSSFVISTHASSTVRPKKAPAHVLYGGGSGVAWNFFFGIKLKLPYVLTYVGRYVSLQYRARRGKSTALCQNPGAMRTSESWEAVRVSLLSGTACVSYFYFFSTEESVTYFRGQNHAYTQRRSVVTVA